MGYSLKRSAIRVIKISSVILLILGICDLTVSGWGWGIVDYLAAFFMFVLLGLGTDYARIKISNPIFKLVAITAITLAFILMWTELAVGAVSKGLSWILNL